LHFEAGSRQISHSLGKSPRIDMGEDVDFHKALSNPDAN
jgi:hypothetical protein